MKFFLLSLIDQAAVLVICVLSVIGAIFLGSALLPDVDGQSGIWFAFFGLFTVCAVLLSWLWLKISPANAYKKRLKKEENDD